MGGGGKKGKGKGKGWGWVGVIGVVVGLDVDEFLDGCGHTTLGGFVKGPPNIHNLISTKREAFSQSLMRLRPVGFHKDVI